MSIDPRMKTIWLAVRQRLRLWLDHHQPRADLVLLSTALVTGITTGLTTVLFIELIILTQAFFFTTVPSWFNQGPSIYWYAFLPTVGGAIAGPIIYRFAKETQGSGIPEVLRSVAVNQSHIRPIVILIKPLVSALCIGTGGAVGREGPVVHIGAAIGSNLGQLLHLSESRVRSLVACGAAAGISAAFNSPIAGAIFAQEVILSEFTTRYFGTVVISSVAASIVSRSLLGDFPSFLVPAYQVVSYWELIPYSVLGILAGLVALLLFNVLGGIWSFSDRWSFPKWGQPAVGGLLLGALVLFLPQSEGMGLSVIEQMLVSPVGIGLALVLMLGKIFATSVTVGFGNSGGIFAPVLFIGAMLGAVVGGVVNLWFPGQVATAGAYALVGMAAVLAASTRASITAILIVFEMSNDYKLILPLMLAVVLATLVSEWLMSDTLYTLRLTRQGIRLEQGRDIDVMQGVSVAEAMTTDVDTVLSTMTLVELAEEFDRSHHHGFPVITPAGELHGIVTLADLSRSTKAGLPLSTTKVGEITTCNVLVAYSDEPVWAALRRLGVRDIGRLPVVDRDDPHHLVGLIRRGDIVKAYNKAILRKHEEQHHERLKARNFSGTQFVDLVLPSSSWAIGQRVADLCLPEGCVMVNIIRPDGEVLPKGHTVLRGGDHITALLRAEDVVPFRRVLQSKEQPDTFRRQVAPPPPTQIDPPKELLS